MLWKTACLIAFWRLDLTLYEQRIVCPCELLNNTVFKKNPWLLQSKVTSKRRLEAIKIPGRDDISAYEKGGDARRKFWIKPLKETDLGVAQAFFDP